MFRLRFIVPAIIAVIIAAACIPASADKPTVNNPYGVHFLLTDMSEGNIDKHLTMAKNLIGKHGYAKQLVLGISEHSTGARDDWKMFVQKCYDYEIIPVIRLCGHAEDGMWLKPYADGPYDYTSVAQGIKNVVADFPLSDEYPLYIEVFNETNNHYEWSGKADPLEFGHFYVQAAKAIRSIGDPRIKIMPGALSPGGSYDNLRFIDIMCREVPGFIDSFDVWASHPYPTGPPEINRHNGTLPKTKWQFGIDGYVAELDVLAKYGRKDVKVMLTETGYSLGPEGEDFLADQTLRVFRDCWSQWPEVLAILPFTFNDPFGGFASGDWVYTNTGIDENGLPTKAHANYWAVYKLAKPVDDFGSVTGKVTEAEFDSPIKGATVVLSTGEKTTTDGCGNYWFPRLKPGTYSVEASKAGYAASASGKVTISAGTNGVGDVALSAVEQGTIRGVIRDSVTGQGLPKAMVMLTPGEYRTLTQADGSFVLDGVPPSTYSLTAVKWDYYTITQDGISVGPGETAEVSFYTGAGRPPRGNTIIGRNSFEAGDDGPAGGWVIWEDAQQPGALAVDHNVRYTGNACQRITPKGSARNHVWQMTNYSSIEPGKKYRIEVWAKCENAVGEVKLVGSWFTNETVDLGSFTAEPVITGTTGWTKLVGVGTAPEFPEGKNGRLQVKVEADLKSGTAWFDEAWAGVDR